MNNFKTIRNLIDELESELTGGREKEYFEIHKERFYFILLKISELVPKGGKILDVGCYPGHLYKLLERMGYVVNGVSSEFEAMKDKNIKSFNIESGEWPIKNSEYDLVLMTEIVEHLIVDPKKYLSEVNRVLKKSGTVFITTPNVVRLQNLITLMLGKNIYFPLKQYEEEIYHRHNREFILNEWKEILKKSDFKKVEGGYFIGYPPYRERNKKDSLVLSMVKWANYLLAKIWTTRQDSLWIYGKV